MPSLTIITPLLLRDRPTYARSLNESRPVAQSSSRCTMVGRITAPKPGQFALDTPTPGYPDLDCLFKERAYRFQHMLVRLQRRMCVLVSNPRDEVRSG
jgi:hypothetical protein